MWRFLRSQRIDLRGRKSWCESKDPEFAAKAPMWSGCTWRHRRTLLVFCVDEKPSIQALERAQGYLKLPNGRALTGHSHDYKRHGTSTLFAAFDVATGKVTVAHKKRRRRVEFLGFMNQIVAAYADARSMSSRQPQYPQAEERPLAAATPERALPLHADAGVVAQSSGNLVLDPRRTVPALAPPSSQSPSSANTLMTSSGLQ